MPMSTYRFQIPASVEFNIVAESREEACKRATAAVAFEIGEGGRNLPNFGDKTVLFIANPTDLELVDESVPTENLG